MRYYATPARIQTRPVITDTPWNKVAIDICGPLVTSLKGHILAIVDHFTKYAILVAIPSQKTITIADALIQKCFLIYEHQRN